MGMPSNEGGIIKKIAGGTLFKEREERGTCEELNSLKRSAVYIYIVIYTYVIFKGTFQISRQGRLSMEGGIRNCDAFQ